ncbi:metallophosphoesterase family protein [soil metagenome]
MRVALLSDIHANLVALEAGLADIGPVDGIWVMGDTVGYGPQPSEVLALLRGRGANLVAGNHDRAVATGEGLDLFNPTAAAAVRLHRAWLSAEERDHLGALELVARRDDATLFHGSLVDPLWEYVFEASTAERTLARAETSISCNSHTHVPALFRREGGAVRGGTVRAGRPYPLPDLASAPAAAGDRVLVNPGSVGQPRDHDAKASWAVLDDEQRTITFGRTAYDVATTQRLIRREKLPEFLAERLAFGI